MNIVIELPSDFRTIYCAADLVDIGEKGGLYCLYSDVGRLLYIGKANNLKNRVSSHFYGISHIKHFSGEIAYAEVFIVNHPAEREVYETYMINKFKPQYNKSKVYYPKKVRGPKVSVVSKVVKREEVAKVEEVVELVEKDDVKRAYNSFVKTYIKHLG